MKPEDVERKGFNMHYLMACNLCSNYSYVGRIGGTELCQSKESPYYEPPDHRYEFKGIFLKWWEELKGCNQFRHNGKRISATKFKSVPSDSVLRTLPPETVIDGFSDKLDIEPYISTNDIIDASIDREMYIDDLVKTGKRAHELKATCPILMFVDGLLVSYDTTYKKIIKIYFGDRL